MKSLTVYFRKKSQNSPLACTFATAEVASCEDQMAQGGHSRGQTPGHVMKFNPVPLKYREALALISTAAGLAPLRKALLKTISSPMPHSPTC